MDKATRDTHISSFVVGLHNAVNEYRLSPVMIEMYYRRAAAITRHLESYTDEAGMLEEYDKIIHEFTLSVYKAHLDLYSRPYKQGTLGLALETTRNKAMKTAKQLQSQINVIAKSGAALQDKVQALFVEVAEHSLLNGECSLVGALALALGKGQKRELFAAYVESVLPVVRNNDKESRNERPFKWSSKQAKSEQFQDHLQTIQAIKDGAAWYDYEVPKPISAAPEEFDAAKALLAVAKRLAKANEDGLKIVGLTPEQIKQLAELVAQVQPTK